MTKPEAYRLDGKTLRVLLAGLGCQNIYGLLPGNPVSDNEGMSCLAALIRDGVVHNNGSRLEIEDPLRSWLMSMAWARRVLRVFVPDDAWPDICVYPVQDSDMAVSCMESNSGSILRLTCVPKPEVWDHLCDACPSLILPASPDSGELCMPPEDLPGEQFRIQLYVPGKGMQRQVVACWGSGNYLIVEGDSAELFSDSIMQGKIMEWLGELI